MNVTGGCEWRRDFRGVINDVGVAVGWIESIASDLRLSEGPSYAMQVCLEELMANIARHGRGPQAQTPPTAPADAPKVSVCVKALTDRIRVTIEDDGRPFDVAAAAPRRVGQPMETVQPGGLGIQLINSFADELRYSRTEKGNCVVAEFMR